MSLSVHALASGSSGNSTLVKHCCKGNSTYILIDAGLSVHGMIAALACFGVNPDMLSGIVLTHEHVDHSRAAHPLARKFGMPVICNAKTLDSVLGAKSKVVHEVLPVGARVRFGALEVETFSVPHDACDPVGVNVYCEGFKVSQVTDAGCITPTIRSAVKNANLLILEANHDVYRLRAGPYPAILKRRILSDRGHLSNETAVQFLVEHLRNTGPCSMWLAHLSKTNNLPKLAMNYANATLKLDSRHPFLLDVARRDRPSLTWTAGERPLQLNLFQ